jgi:hypothetical protein
VKVAKAHKRSKGHTRVASAKKAKGKAASKTAVAKKDDGKGDGTKGDGKKVAKKSARVSKTFAARDEHKG